MLVDKNEIHKLIKEKKVTNSIELNDVLRTIAKEVIETMYDGELTELLGYTKNSKSGADNARNGYGTKTVNSTLGEIELNPPRDRKSEFEPKVVKKRQSDISGLEDAIISMFAKGMSVRDIQDHMDKIYGLEFSPEGISNITDKVLAKAKEWQSRSLESVYSIIFMDAIFYKIRKDGIVRNMAVYAVIGINTEGIKECLGLWIVENESAKFWLSVLNELKNRGVKDVLIFSIDGLAGLSEAIRAAFPSAEIQRCIVHQVRNSLKFVSWKDRKEVAKDLKKIYNAPTEEAGLSFLKEFQEKWDIKYPNISKSWNLNWTELSTVFKYPSEIRRLIYTTNPIESFNRGLRKVTKNKGSFTTEDSLIKILYLAIEDMSRKWANKIRDWASIYPQLCVYFEGRI